MKKMARQKNPDISLTMRFLADTLRDHMQRGYWLEPVKPF